MSISTHPLGYFFCMLKSVSISICTPAATLATVSIGTISVLFCGPWTGMRDTLVLLVNVNCVGKRLTAKDQKKRSFFQGKK